jgi:hypothetical protein
METQQIVDLVMREIAVRHGSTRRRDFEVALITIEAIESARALPASCGASEDANRSGSASFSSSGEARTAPEPAKEPQG